MEKSRIFIISGPSGAGEDSIINELAKTLPIERIITSTTRPMREGEKDGKDYWFIATEEFQKRLAEGDFVEHAQQYNGNLYGVSRQELDRVSSSGKIGIWKIEYKGVITVKEKFPEIKAVFINTPDLETLERRIRRRSHVSEEYIQERMAYTKEWLKHTAIYDYEVVNADGKLDEAVAKVKEIIEKNLA